jgi:hypothetical protein
MTSGDEVITSADSLKRKVQKREYSPIVLDIANPKELIRLRTAFETTRYIAEQWEKKSQSPQNFAKNTDWGFHSL